MKRTPLSIFAISTTLFIAPLIGNAVGFPDLPSDVSLRGPIEELAAAGILHGYEDGTFQPRRSVSVGEWTKLVLNSRGHVHAEPTRYQTVESAAAQAVVEGLLSASTDLQEPIARLRAMTLLVAAYELTPPVGFSGTTTFVDVPAEHERIVAYLGSLSIVSGINGTHLGTGPLLRQEAAKLVAISMRTIPAPAAVVSTSLTLGSMTQTSLSPGDSTTILFSYVDANGDGLTGLTATDFHLTVVRGSLTVTSFSEIGSGTYAYTLRADQLGPPGPIQIRIIALRSATYQAIEIGGTSVMDAGVGVRVTPTHLSQGQTASIIAIPRNPTNGQPVSGLTLRASVIAGSGSISQQMAENPAGSGMYVGEYTATGLGGGTIRVMIESIVTMPYADVVITQI